MWIMVAGPYRTGSSDPAVWASNLRELNRVAYDVFRKGHVPIVAVNLVLPIVGEADAAEYARIMTPLSLSLTERCDAVLRIGGASVGADEEVGRFEARGLPVFRSLEQVPAIGDRPSTVG
jgi:hypothetical protein